MQDFHNNMRMNSARLVQVWQESGSPASFIADVAYISGVFTIGPLGPCPSLELWKIFAYGKNATL